MSLCVCVCECLRCVSLRNYHSFVGVTQRMGPHTSLDWIPMESLLGGLVKLQSTDAAMTHAFSQQLTGEFVSVCVCECGVRACGPRHMATKRLTS